MSSVSGDISNGSKAISKDLKKGLEKLSNEVSDTFALQAVDLLTKPEIDELRKLVSLDKADAEKYASARMKDLSFQGMYLQLSDLGFIHCLPTFDGTLYFIGVSPKASWAIDRYDKRLAQEEQQKRELRHQRWMDRIFAVGSGIGGTVVGFLLGKFF